VPCIGLEEGLGNPPAPRLPGSTITAARYQPATDKWDSRLHVVAGRLALVAQTAMEVSIGWVQAGVGRGLFVRQPRGASEWRPGRIKRSPGLGESQQLRVFGSQQEAGTALHG
jgi:hypothetical protein